MDPRGSELLSTAGVQGSFKELVEWKESVAVDRLGVRGQGTFCGE